MTNHVKITWKELKVAEILKEVLFINLPSPSLFKWVTLKSIEISFENQLMGLFENEDSTGKS